MAESDKVYQKHQSFVGMRHRGPLPEVLPRVERLYGSLPDDGDARTRVIRRACEELVGKAVDAGGHPPFTLHGNVADEIGRITDAELPRYLHYRFRYETNPQRKVLDDYPPCLQVEPSSICNFRCVFCYQTDMAFTKRSGGHMGTMSLDLFKRIIDQAEGNIEAVTLASRGEPLVCPAIEALLAYMAGKFLASKLNTNAWYLDERKCHAILQADIGTLVFSVDAAEETAYSRLRMGGKLDRVRENIQRFQRIRAERYPESRTITRVSGVKYPGSSGLDDMASYWGEYADQVAFVDYNPWENTYERPVNDLKTPCSDLWRRMFIWWDGRTNPCDVDYRSTLSVGNSKDSSVSGLWRSGPYQELREDHLKKGRSRRSPCCRCTVV
ncbi:MAG: radical SAM/SPASM domain-containing protein [Elusimicrobiota bacterium]